MKKSQLASIELLNGVSNVDGKRWVSTSVKEVDVERRWKKVDKVNYPQLYLTVKITAQEKLTVCLIKCAVSPRCKYIVHLQANVS